MEVAGFSALLAALVPLLALWLTNRPGRSRRAEIRSSLEILELLPPDSMVRPDWQAAVEDRIRTLVESEKSSRDLRNVGYGLYLVVVSVTFFVAGYPAWWVRPIWALAFLVGAFAACEGWAKAPRDSNGVQLRHLGMYRKVFRRARAASDDGVAA